MEYFNDTIGRWGRGNIDLNNRIVVHNQDGTISTERSMSFGDDGVEILVPTVVNGAIVSDDDAIDHYYETGEYLGKFNTVAEADAYAEALHERQQWYYGRERTQTMRSYNEIMGFRVNGTNLPDVSKFTYQVGDLDTSGSRDATGTLHRAYVATKINFEVSWNSLDWEKLGQILALINQPEFQLTAPDPRTFNTTYTGRYYVGDRTGDMHYYLEQKDDIAQFSLKVKFIEY